MSATQLKLGTPPPPPDKILEDPFLEKLNCPREKSCWYYHLFGERTQLATRNLLTSNRFLYAEAYPFITTHPNPANHHTQGIQDFLCYWNWGIIQHLRNDLGRNYLKEINSEEIMAVAKENFIKKQ